MILLICMLFNLTLMVDVLDFRRLVSQVQSIAPQKARKADVPSARMVVALKRYRAPLPVDSAADLVRLVLVATMGSSSLMVIT